MTKLTDNSEAFFEVVDPTKKEVAAIRTVHAYLGRVYKEIEQLVSDFFQSEAVGEHVPLTDQIAFAGTAIELADELYSAAKLMVTISEMREGFEFMQSRRTEGGYMSSNGGRSRITDEDRDQARLKLEEIRDMFQRMKDEGEGKAS